MIPAEAKPIPGFGTVAQVEENAGAMRFGALSAEAISATDDTLAAGRRPCPESRRNRHKAEGRGYRGHTACVARAASACPTEVKRQLTNDKRGVQK